MAATTDCWSQTDLALMEQTRALGRRPTVARRGRITPMTG